MKGKREKLDISSEERRLETFFNERQQVADTSFQKNLKESLIKDYYSEEKNNNTFKKFLFKFKSYMNKKTLKKVAIGGALSAVLISSSYIWLIKEENKNQTEKEATRKDDKRSGFSAAVNINSGYAFSIPNEWSSTISLNSSSEFYGRFFPKNIDVETSYVEIQSGKEGKQSLLQKVKDTQKKEEGDWVITTTNGEEDFKQSTRKFKNITINKKDKPNDFLSVQAWNPNSNTDESMNKVIEKVISGTDKNALHFLGYSKAQAADEEKINGVNIDQYKDIQVMAEPLKDNIDKDNRYYKFQAFKGQRLTAYTLETEESKGSYVESELYSDQNQLLYDMGTRIEFTAPYTGTYYYKVKPIKNRSGETLIKIFDRDQMEDKIYIKYPDGREKVTSTESGPLKIGESEYAIITEFLNPVKIINNNRLEYLYTTQEFGPDRGIVQFDVRAYGVKQTLEESNVDKNGIQSSKVTIPEQNEANRIGHTLTRLSSKKLLITKEDGSLFPKNYHVLFEIESDPIKVVGGGFETLRETARIFSEN